MKNILTEALVNSATNASFIFQLYKFCKVKDEEYYVKALKRAWKKELDPYDEFEHIDLEYIDDVNEYK